MAGEGTGRYLITRKDQLVWCVQEGYFETALEEKFLGDLGLAIEAACAGGGTCQMIADSQKLDGVSLMGRVRFERFMGKHAKNIRQVAVVVPKNSKAGFALSVVADLLPSLRYKFVFSMDEAIKVLGHPPESRPQFDALLAQAVWQGDAKKSA